MFSLSVVVFLVFFCVPFIAACPRDVPSKHFSTESTNSNTFTTEQSYLTIAPHTPFFIQLDSNPSTGYSWSLHPSSDPPTILNTRINKDDDHSLIVYSCSYESSIRAPSNIVGAGGIETWEFISGPSRSTSYRIALQYQRPWSEDKDDPDQVWFVQVTEQQ